MWLACRQRALSDQDGQLLNMLTEVRTIVEDVLASDAVHTKRNRTNILQKLLPAFMDWIVGGDSSE